MTYLYKRWKYRGTLKINPVSDIAGLPLTFTMPYKLGMKRDFSDIRFSTINGTVINYYLISYVEGESAEIMIPVPANVGRVYYHYGNAIAISESDPSKVYTIYDDFSGVLTTYWGVSGASIVDDGTGNKVCRLSAAYIYSKLNTLGSLKIEYKLMLKSVNASTSVIFHRVYARSTANEGRINCLLDGTTLTGTSIYTSTTQRATARPYYELDKWYNCTFITTPTGISFKITDGVSTTELFYESTITGTGSIQFNQPSSGGIVWIDAVRVTPYSNVNPIITVESSSIVYDHYIFLGNTISLEASLGLKGAYSLSQPPITADSRLGLHPKYAEVMPPIDAGNGEIWIHSRIKTGSFINPYGGEIKHIQDYSSKSIVNGYSSSLGFSPAALQMDRLSLSSGLGITPGGGQTAGKYKIETRIKHKGRHSSKSSFSVEGGQLGNIPDYMTLERHSFNMGLGLEGIYQGIRDFIALLSEIQSDQIIKYTFERTIIKTPGELKFKPWVMYKSPFTPLHTSLSLQPQAYPIKKKFFLIDYNVKTVDIRKSISDALWTLEAEFAGPDAPNEFEGLNHSAVDYTGDVQHLFTGLCPDSSPTISNTASTSRITAYDYGYYLSKQFLDENSETINLQGSITSWRDWIIYLLKGTGITPYKVAYVDMPDVTFLFSGKTTKREAIDAISDYCNCIFEVRFFNHGTLTSPNWITGAYWVKVEDIDSFSQGLDIPDPVVFTWPNPHMMDLPEVSGNPEEKVNRVKIRGTDGTNVFKCTLETAEVTNGDDIAREYYEDREDNPALTSQVMVDQRAAELIAYYENPPAQITARLIKRYDLQLYQKIKFDENFPSHISSLTNGSRGGIEWMRIKEINYHCEGGNEYVEIIAISDTPTALLLAASGTGSFTIIDNIETLVNSR